MVCCENWMTTLSEPLVRHRKLYKFYKYCRDPWLVQLGIREINLNRRHRDQPPTEKKAALSMGHKLALESDGPGQCWSGH